MECGHDCSILFIRPMRNILRNQERSFIDWMGLLERYNIVTLYTNLAATLRAGCGNAASPDSVGGMTGK